MSGVVRALEVRFAHFLEPHGYMSVVNERHRNSLPLEVLPNDVEAGPFPFGLFVFGDLKIKK